MLTYIFVKKNYFEAMRKVYIIEIRKKRLNMCYSIEYFYIYGQHVE